VKTLICGGSVALPRWCDWVSVRGAAAPPIGSRLGRSAESHPGPGIRGSASGPTRAAALLAVLVVVAGMEAMLAPVAVGVGGHVPISGSGSTWSSNALDQWRQNVIINWSGPAIRADNPGRTLPVRQIVPVVYFNGSGTSMQFTAWMADQYPAEWDAYCHWVGRNITPCGLVLGPPLVARTMRSPAGPQGGPQS